MPDSIASPWVTTFSSTQLLPVADRSVSSPSGRRTRANGVLALSPARRLTTHAGSRPRNARYRTGALDRVVRRATAGPILSAAIFRSAVVRERRRADRSKEPFAVLSFDLAAASAPRVAAALSSLSSEHCFVGWMEDGGQLGRDCHRSACRCRSTGPAARRRHPRGGRAGSGNRGRRRCPRLDLPAHRPDRHRRAGPAGNRPAPRGSPDGGSGPPVLRLREAHSGHRRQPDRPGAVLAGLSGRGDPRQGDLAGAGVLSTEPRRPARPDLPDAEVPDDAGGQRPVPSTRSS